MPYIVQDRSKLHYQVFGKGPKIMLAFHGYGQESYYYHTLGDVLRPDYTIYAFDLFFHGSSQLFKTDMPLTKEFLLRFMAHFLEKEKISTFSVMAFSMGGKFALTLLEGYPERLEKLILIAPDGIGTSFWYNIATYPGWLQGLFKRTVVKPDFLFGFMNTLHRYRMVDASLVKFATFQMSSTEKRLRVYKSWIGFRNLTFDIRRIVDLLNTHQIPVFLFTGEFDQVIPQKRLQVFVQSLQRVQVINLRTGHSYLLHEVINYLRREKQILQAD